MTQNKVKVIDLSVRHSREPVTIATGRQQRVSGFEPLTFRTQACFLHQISIYLKIYVKIKHTTKERSKVNLVINDDADWRRQEVAEREEEEGGGE